MSRLAFIATATRARLPKLSTRLLTTLSRSRPTTCTRHPLLHLSSTKEQSFQHPCVPKPANATMSAEEDPSQSGYDDSMAGPGAPTPLSALEACCRANQ